MKITKQTKSNDQSMVSRIEGILLHCHVFVQCESLFQ